MSNFEFDRKFLQDTVSMLNAKLSDKSLSVIEKASVENDLHFFNNMLKGNFENTDDDFYYCEEDYYDSDDSDYTVDDFVKMFLEKCRELYCVLGVRAINLIIKLYEDGVFYHPSYIERKVLPIEEQAEYTIKNYEKNSKKLLVPAKKILFPKDYSHIQCVDSLDESSYCYFSEILHEPFVVVDPENGESILNHEVEHACESILGIDNKIIFEEVGSIFHELLFSDLLMSKLGNDYLTSFDERVIESTCYIERLYPLFCLIKYLKKYDFEISKDKLLKLCWDYGLVDEETNFYDFVNDNVVNCGFDTMINYLFSHLKAIELREKLLLTKKDSLDLLVEEMSKPLTYRCSDDKVLIYKRFLSDIECKR